MDEEEAKLRKRFEYASETELEAAIRMHGAGSPAGRIAYNIVRERGRELRHFARIIAWATVVTAAATVAAALAAWTAVCFQFGHPQAAPNESRQPASSVTPAPSPSP